MVLLLCWLPKRCSFTGNLYQTTWECPTNVGFSKYAFHFISPQLFKMVPNHLFMTLFAFYNKIRHTANFFSQYPVPTFYSDTKINCNDLAWIILTSCSLVHGKIMKALLDLCLQGLSNSPLKSLPHLSTLQQASGANIKSQLEREWKLVRVYSGTSHKEHLKLALRLNYCLAGLDVAFSKSGYTETTVILFSTVILLSN